MKFYIIDDNEAMVDVLEDIITDMDMGEIAGKETDPLAAIEDIGVKKPDIVLVDFMMSGMDGIKLVTTLKSRYSHMHFIMISKISDKSVVHKAYDAGVEFFINKPISRVEVERVLDNVAERINLQTMMDSIRSMFDDSHLMRPVYKGSGSGGVQETPGGISDFRNIDILMSELGILGENGAKDIRLLCKYTADNGRAYDKSILDRVAEEEGDNVRNIEQRVRRAIRKGLRNAAKAGLEDIGGDKFTIYANYVYDYSSLRDEMNYITGKSGSGGRISVPRFIEGILLYDSSM